MLLCLLSTIYRQAKCWTGQRLHGKNQLSDTADAPITSDTFQEGQMFKLRGQSDSDGIVQSSFTLTSSAASAKRRSMTSYPTRRIMRGFAALEISGLHWVCHGKNTKLLSS